MQDAPPLPLSAIAAAVLTAFGSHLQAESPSPDSLELDCCGPPSTSCWWRRAGGCPTAPACVSIRRSSPSGASSWRGPTRGRSPCPSTGRSGPPGDELPVAALRRSLEEAPRGPLRAVIAHKLAAACERANDEEGAVAALRICIENAAAGPLVGTAWRRLVELYARRGDPHAAARALIASADYNRTGASEAERAAALIAAAEILRKRLSLPGDAGMLLERAIALDPSSIEALEALEALTTETGAFKRLADVLERKLQVAARGPVEQQEILSRLIQIYGGPVPGPERARTSASGRRPSTSRRHRWSRSRRPRRGSASPRCPRRAPARPRRATTTMTTTSRPTRRLRPPKRIGGRRWRRRQF